VFSDPSRALHKPGQRFEGSRPWKGSLNGPRPRWCSSPHEEYDEKYTFSVADEEPADVVGVLEDSGAEILLNYLPVGSEKATRYYAKCALEAGTAFINNMPVFIASNPKWASRFEEAGLPVIGDDIKAQIGATITHRTLTQLFKNRVLG